MADNIKTYPVPCQGGLRSNLDPITQGGKIPGSGIRMINYEPALKGGYRRIDGYANDYGTVPGFAAAPVLGVFVSSDINNGIFACRKPEQIPDTATNYNYFHFWSGTAWVTPNVSGNPTMTNVTRVRFNDFNWGTPKLVLTDGVNPAATWDGVTYVQISHAQAPTAPKLSENFANHMFLASDPSEPHNLYFSAPVDETNFSPSAGAGVINTGFKVVQIKSFRNQLYIFGTNQIKRLSGSNASDFRLDSVTNSLGCLAADSVIEFNADLLFLSPDGIRPISATERIGDIEIATVSKPIQTLFDQFSATEDMTDVTILPIRRKSQFRLFFPDKESLGIIGALRLSGLGDGGSSFEFSQLIGIDVYCGASGYIGDEEFVVHGDSQGKVFRQESGNDFDGVPIFSLYQTPYLYMDDILVRKTFYSVTTYLLTEGTVTVNASVEFDYGDTEVEVAANYAFDSVGAASFFGSSSFDTTDIYDGNPSPVKKLNITGSGSSVSVRYVTTVTQPSHTIQALALEYGLADRR